jgi:hypothetical protein
MYFSVPIHRHSENQYNYHKTYTKIGGRGDLNSTNKYVTYRIFSDGTT